MASSHRLRDALGQEHDVLVDGDALVSGERRFTVTRRRDGSFRIEGDATGQAWAARSGDEVWVFVGGRTFTFSTGERPRRRGGGGHQSLAAPMPATVLHVPVERGQTVKKGDVLVVLEAMKMELPVRAPADGIVAAVRCRPGEMVQAGQELVDVDA